MPIASTNSGNAMMVSAMRPTMRSVQPPKKPAATREPAEREDQRHRSDGDAEIEPGRDHHGEKTSRPSWSVPNQCARDGGCSAEAVLLASGS
jgi:hypothetical protein